MNTDPAHIAKAVIVDGFAEWPAFVTGDRLDKLIAAADALLASEHAHAYPKSTRAWDLHLHGPEFINLVTDRRLAQLFDEVLGTGHLLSDLSLNSVNPGQPIDDWHIDYPFNEMPQLVSGATLGVQCVLALSQFTEVTGASQLIPGTHREPSRPPSGCPTAPRTFEARPGTLLVMAAATWHRSGINRSSRRRSAILLSFVERWIRPMSAPVGLPEPVPARLANLLGLQRAPETINGVPI
jgi:ectoine hydroxylase-related dioxygenase (phytanoyl-CoA dioxygenase family)